MLTNRRNQQNACCPQIGKIGQSRFNDTEEYHHILHLCPAAVIVEFIDVDEVKFVVCNLLSFPFWTFLQQHKAVALEFLIV